jgi:dolichyl-phosphate beta-glucosyltransferase
MADQQGRSPLPPPLLVADPQPAPAGVAAKESQAVADVDAGSERVTVLRPTANGSGGHRAPVRGGTALTLILPCYNEAERLPTTLAVHLAALSQRPGEVEVLVVDDGSTDQTVAVATAIAARDQRVRVIRTQPNHGKGFAVRTGVLAATGQLIVFTDADGSYGPGAVARVVAALADAPVAIGSRAAGQASGPLVRRLASRLFNRAIQSLLGLPFRDTQCGVKGFQRQAALEVFGRARLDGFAFDAEVLLLAWRLGLQVSEVHVHAEQRDGSTVRLVVDALRMLRDVLLVRHRATSGGHKGDDGAGGKAADTSSPAPLPDAEVGRAAQVG